MTPSTRRAYATLAASTALVTLAACGGDDGGGGAAPVGTSTPSMTTGPAASPSAGSTDGEFTPGEYEAIGTYLSPDGQTQSVEVEVEIAADGTITDLDVDGRAESGNSEQYQGKFESGIDQLVVGRRITELQIDKVAGSSLTSGGFNDAIGQIIERARA